ncbi:MAG: Localization factor PodJS, partial [Pseudomonadota bacterium]
MTQRGPWSVKGIDDRARLAARDAARVEGLTLGAYLNKLILEEGAAASEDDTDLNRDTAAKQQPNAHPNQTARSAHDIASTALDRLTRRIESTEARSTLA